MDVGATQWGERARHWADIEEGQAIELYERVFDALRITARVELLDIGCGSGIAAGLAVNRGASVAGVDASTALLEIARVRVPESSFCSGPMEELPFQDDQFGIAVAFNSLQFSDDPLQALAEARRVVKPGGAIAAVVWGSPTECETATVLNALTPPSTRGHGQPLRAFSLSDEGIVIALLDRAGLAGKRLFSVRCTSHYPDADTAINGLASGGTGAAAIRAVGEEQTRQMILEALQPFEQGKDRYALVNTFICAVAVN